MKSIKILSIMFIMTTMLSLSGCGDISLQASSNGSTSTKTTDKKSSIEGYTKYSDIDIALWQKYVSHLNVGEDIEIDNIKDVVVEDGRYTSYTFYIPYKFTDKVGMDNNKDSESYTHYGKITFYDYQYVVDIVTTPDTTTKKLYIKKLDSDKYFLRIILPEKATNKNDKTGKEVGSNDSNLLGMIFADTSVYTTTSGKFSTTNYDSLYKLE